MEYLGKSGMGMMRSERQFPLEPYGIGATLDKTQDNH